MDLSIRQSIFSVPISPQGSSSGEGTAPPVSPGAALCFLGARYMVARVARVAGTRRRGPALPGDRAPRARLLGSPCLDLVCSGAARAGFLGWSSWTWGRGQTQALVPDSVPRQNGQHCVTFALSSRSRSQTRAEALYPDSTSYVSYRVSVTIGHWFSSPRSPAEAHRVCFQNLMLVMFGVFHKKLLKCFWPS